MLGFFFGGHSIGVYFTRCTYVCVYIWFFLVMFSMTNDKNI